MATIETSMDIYCSYVTKDQWEDGADLVTIHGELNTILDNVTNLGFDSLLLFCQWDEASSTATMRCRVMDAKYSASSDIDAADRDTLIAAIESEFSGNADMSQTNIVMTKVRDDETAST